jgi:hypothetical protein
MHMKRTLGDILVEERLIARSQLKQAMHAAERRGSPLVSVLLEQGLVAEDALVDALCRRLNLEVFDPVRHPVDLDAVREVPLEEANRYRLLPLQLDERHGRRVLRLAMADPLDAQAIEDIEFSTSSTVEPLIARPSQLMEAIRNHYRGVVTKIIPRNRLIEGAPAEDPLAAVSTPGLSAPVGFPREPFGAGLDSAALSTQPMARLHPGRRADGEKYEALVTLLVRKGLISREELEEELARGGVPTGK